MPWEPPAARGEGLCPEVSTERRPAEPVPSQRCVSCGSERAAQSDSGACRAEYSQAKGQRYLGPTKELRRPSSDTPPPPTGLNDGVLAKLQRLTAPPGNQVHGRGDPELMPSHQCHSSSLRNTQVLHQTKLQQAVWLEGWRPAAALGGGLQRGSRDVYFPLGTPEGPDA